MSRSDGRKLTAVHQGHPEALREIFLQAVLDEASRYGYSVESKGRLFVIALRSWEKR